MRLRACLVILIGWTVACTSSESTTGAATACPAVECVGVEPYHTADVCDPEVGAPFPDLECHRFEVQGGKRTVGVWVPRSASQLNDNVVDTPHPTCVSCKRPVAGLGRIVLDETRTLDVTWDPPTGGSYGQFLLTGLGTAGIQLEWGDVLVAPGNGAVYTVVRHGGHGLEQRDKHVYDETMGLYTPGSEFSWVGVTGVVAKDVPVYSDKGRIERLATVAKGQPMSVLVCENERQTGDGSHAYLRDWIEPRCLVKTEFGLVGWTTLDWGRARADGTVTQPPIVEGMFYTE